MIDIKVFCADWMSESNSVCAMAETQEICFEDVFQHKFTFDTGMQSLS